MSFVVRECYEEDFEHVAMISRTLYANKAGSFSLVSKWNDHRMLKKYVVINGDEQVAGYGLLWEQSTSPNLILKIEILFSREHENPIAVDTLFEMLANDIQRIKPKAVQARTFDDQPHLLHFYRKYGFEENHRMVHVYLTVADADLTPFVELEHRLMSQGIMITTQANEQICDANYLNKLQTLNKITWADYPVEPLLPPPSPNDMWLTHKDNIPDAYFIAKMRETYIGHSHLMKMESGSVNLIQGLTATLGEFRGKGVATALKVKGIEYAKRNGYKGIFTSHRDTNIPMKTVNDKFGFRPSYNEVRLEKT